MFVVYILLRPKHSQTAHVRCNRASPVGRNREGFLPEELKSGHLFRFKVSQRILSCNNLSDSAPVQVLGGAHGSKQVHCPRASGSTLRANSALQYPDLYPKWETKRFQSLPGHYRGGLTRVPASAGALRARCPLGANLTPPFPPSQGRYSKIYN